MTLGVAIRKRLASGFTLDVALEAAAGITIIFGESGSGKTTLLRAVAGLTPLDAGAIRIGDRLLFDSATGVNVPSSQRQVGFVFQHLALFPHLTVRENIEYGLTALPVPERARRTAAITDSFRIGGVLDRRPPQTSGGERQRIGLARSLVTDPAVLLLDEPLSALDRGTQSRIIADLRRWNESHRIPILYVTHSQREAFALGERVVVLQDGAVVADGTPQQVLDAPAHERVASLAGFENLVDVVVVDRRPEAGVMLTRLDRCAVELEAPLADVNVGAPLRLAIRAGDILIATERPRGLSARNVVPGTIRAISDQGRTVRADIDIGVPLEVHITPTSRDELGLRAGRDVWIVVKTHSCRPVDGV